ncbi:MAG TPA: shikimate kinase [Chthoniobacterales bacterium]
MRNESLSIVLIGFMGSGKSSVGRLLARQLGWPRWDTDEMVAAELGRSIPQIFAEWGEARFREAESEVLRKLDAKESAIIVTGGGIVLRPKNVARLRELGTVVWLRADLETLRERLSRRKNRPLLQTPDPAATIAKLLEEREKYYEEAADFAVETDGRDHRAVAEAVCDEIQIAR